jgi:hypothetical protein
MKSAQDYCLLQESGILAHDQATIHWIKDFTHT